MANEVGEVTSEMIERIVKQTAKEVVSSLQNDIREQITEEVSRGLKSHFGDMTPTQHSVQHANIEKLLTRLDNLSSGFYGGIVSKIASALITVLILGLAAWGLKSGIGS